MVAAVKVTGIPEQTGFAEGEIVMVTGFSGLTIICMVLEVAGLFEMQTVIDEVKMHDTRSPDAGLYVKKGLFDPTMIPFTFQRYDGEDPPLVGNAVKVTGVPAQTLFMDAEIVTFTESPAFTVTGKSTAVPEQFPTFGVMWYVTIPVVGREFNNTWLMISPESGLKPVTFPVVKDAVQVNVAPETLEVSGILVDSPEQMDLERGLLVTDGGAIVESCTVSVPVHSVGSVTTTL
jgi:hypothetical protein